MSEPSIETLRAVWQQLARRNDWKLAADEAAFLQRAAAAAGGIRASGSAAPEAQVRLALQRCYAALLYEGLRSRDERAAYELWLAFYRLALRDGGTPDEAQVLAQETFARVLNGLDALRAPESLISWSACIFRTVRNTLRRVGEKDTPLIGEEERHGELPEIADSMAAAEDRLLSGQILSELRAALPNQLERLVLLRIVAFGDHPRNVAQDLGIPLHRTRLAKSRALQRLRKDARFVRFLEGLSAPPQPPAGTGKHDDRARQ